MILCKFTRDASLLCEGIRFWLVGEQAGIYNGYDLHDQVDGDIVAAVNLDEGRCHIATQYGAVWEITADRETGFKIAKVKSA